jgi:hypothetical protein
MSSGFVDITTNSEAEGLFLLAPLHTTMLVVDAKNGNEQAFELLVKRHLRKILSVALGFTRSQGDAEDIAQRSLQEAFVHLRTLEGKSSFCPWLTRIAINEFGYSCALSTEETVRRLGASVNATKSNVLRGRRKLREALKWRVRSPRIAGVIAADAAHMSRGRRACHAACDGGWCGRRSSC